MDREAGIIYGVKVLGLKSDNGREYLPEAVQSAIALYEGRSVRTNHPKRGRDSRDVHEVFGWLEGVEVDESGGLRGNLRILNPRTELAESVMNAAESAPHLFGLSHNAEGDVVTQGGRKVVREILEVHSVDLVTDPATTKGLFEHKGAGKVKTTLKKLFEALKLDRKNKKRIDRLFEMDMMDPEQEMEADMPAEPPEPGGGDHTSMLRQGFEGAVNHLVAQCLDGSMDPTECLKKIKELLNTHGKVNGSSATPEEEEEIDEEDDEEELEEECDDDMKESRRRLKARERAYDLLEEAGLPPTDKVLVEALVSLGDEKKQKALIAREKAKGGSQRRPRTQSVTEGRNGDAGPIDTREIKDGKGFASALREGRFVARN